MSKKDPAFLFYPKDWLQGTSQLMPDEKGVYIDLLAHQHQDGDLPNDTRRLARMVGISEQEFLVIWEQLKSKFVATNGNRLVNQKLTEIVTERSTKSTTNKVIGQFAAIIRLSNMSNDEKEKIKQEFKVEDFLGNSDRTVKEQLTEWLASRSKSIGNAEYINTNKESLTNPPKNKKNGNGFVNFNSQGYSTLIEVINSANEELRVSRENDLPSED